MATLDAVLNIVRRFDAMASANNALTRIDARAQILASLAVIITVSSFSAYTVIAMLPLLLFPMVMVGLGQISIQWLLLRMVIALPFVFFCCDNEPSA